MKETLLTDLNKNKDKVILINLHNSWFVLQTSPYALQN